MKWVAPMASGRANLRSRMLQKIISLISFIWLIGTLCEVNFTSKDDGVSYDVRGCHLNILVMDFRSNGKRTNVVHDRSKRFLGLRLAKYSNSTVTFQLSRLAQCGDINPNPGTSKILKCSSCERTIAKNHRNLHCLSCSSHMHNKCGNVRPSRFLKIVSGIIAGCSLFSDLPFNNWNGFEIAQEFEFEDNLHPVSNNNNIFQHISHGGLPSQNQNESALFADRNVYTKEVLLCHLIISSIQNKFEELAMLIKNS